MNQFELGNFLQSLEQRGFDPRLLGAVIVGVVIALLLIVYLLRKQSASPAAVVKTPASSPAVPKPARNIPQEPKLERRSSIIDEIPETPPQAAAAETASPVTPPAPAPKQTPVIAAQIPAKPIAATAPLPHIPQESVLKRHYLTHIRYMIESTIFPRPTESVLRRHYEQLVGSIQEACVNDAAELDKLIRRYDEQRKNTIG